MTENNIVTKLSPYGMNPIFLDLQTVGGKCILPKASQLRYRFDKRLDDRHTFGTIGNLVNDPMMKPDFKTPNRLFLVIAGIRETLFIAGSLPDAFHKRSFVGNIDFLRLVIETGLKAVSLAEGESFTATVHG